MPKVINNSLTCICCKKKRYTKALNPYCSQGCKYKHIGYKKTCNNCHKEFIPSTSINTFCSKKCSNEFTKQKYQKTKHLIGIKQSRFIILSRSDFRCIYCGIKAINGNEMHIDHVYPLSKGGKNDVFNLAASCITCNIEKNAHVLPEKTILDIWQHNIKSDISSGVVKSYAELKAEFDKYGFK